MTEPANARGRQRIITRLYELTEEMHRRREDADFLVASIEKRQALMDEYDQTRLQNPDDALTPETEAELGQMVQKILSMDTAIATALEGHKSAAKEALASTNTQRKVLGYVNNAISSSGSYMDYKK